MIPCPRCGNETHVRETRGIYRRRVCVGCTHRISTKEVLADDLALIRTLVGGDILDHKSSQMLKTDHTLSIGEVARMLGVTPRQVRSNDERLRPLRTPKGHRVYSKRVVTQFLADGGVTARLNRIVGQVNCSDSSDVSNNQEASCD